MVTTVRVTIDSIDTVGWAVVQVVRWGTHVVVLV